MKDQRGVSKMLEVMRGREAGNDTGGQEIRIPENVERGKSNAEEAKSFQSFRSTIQISLAPCASGF